jgi:hypothetical protein
MRGRRILLGLVLLGVALLVAWRVRERRIEFRPKPAAAATVGAVSPAPIAVAVAAPTASERSHLVDGLNSPSGDIHADLRMLNEVFIALRGATRGLNPIGENAEITAVLTGHNRLGFAFIPLDCGAIDGKGQLVDRWGSPYFFHQLGGEKMEIRSAGPDRVLWTADDEVLTP